MMRHSDTADLRLLISTLIAVTHNRGISRKVQPRDAVLRLVLHEDSEKLSSRCKPESIHTRRPTYGCNQ